MDIHVIAVGKLKSAEVAALIEEYAKRLPKGVRLSWTEAPGESGKVDPAEAMAREAARIREKMPGRAHLAVLSESGKEMDSRELARWIGDVRDRGLDLCFVIGGAEGVDPSLESEAHTLLSLSRLTFPHELTRAILAEQIYRAFTILLGLPYHR